jgi:hypothetical protein
LDRESMWTLFDKLSYYSHLWIINSKKACTNAMFWWFDNQKQSKEQHLWLMGLHAHDDSENNENNFFSFERSTN